jgi:hypothetical protein
VGSVQFHDGTGFLLCNASVAADGVARCTTTFAGSPRTTTVVADYSSSDSVYASRKPLVSATLNLVDPAAAAVSALISTDSNPVLIDVQFLIRLDLAALAGNDVVSVRPSGLITVTDSAGNVLTSAPVSNGAIFRAAVLHGEERTERLTMNYSGDKLYAATTATIDIPVRRGVATFGVRGVRTKDGVNCRTTAYPNYPGSIVVNSTYCQYEDVWTLTCTGSCLETGLCTAGDTECAARFGARYWVATEFVSGVASPDPLGRICGPTTTTSGGPRTFDTGNLNGGGKAFVGTSNGIAGTWAPIRAPAFDPAAPTRVSDTDVQNTDAGEVARVLGVQVDPAWKATFYDPDPNGCLLVRQQVDSTLGIVVYDAVLRTYQRFELRSVWP